MNTLQNKRALITGGTSGIGRAAAEIFISEGAKVIITGRNRQTVDEAVKQLGPQAHGLVADNGKLKDVLALREKVEAIFPAIDILFANAGYGKFAPIEMMAEETFDELFNVLVKGTYFTIKEMLPIMGTGGSVIINSSVVNSYGSENSSFIRRLKRLYWHLLKTLRPSLPQKVSGSTQ